MAKRGTTKPVNGELVKQLIDSTPWGPRGVAARAKVGIQTVYQMTRGERVEAKLIAKVAAVFGKRGEELFENTAEGKEIVPYKAKDHSSDEPSSDETEIQKRHTEFKIIKTNEQENRDIMISGIIQIVRNVELVVPATIEQLQLLNAMIEKTTLDFRLIQAINSINWNEFSLFIGGQDISTLYIRVALPCNTIDDPSLRLERFLKDLGDSPLLKSRDISIREIQEAHKSGDFPLSAFVRECYTISEVGGRYTEILEFTMLLGEKYAIETLYECSPLNECFPNTWCLYRNEGIVLKAGQYYEYIKQLEN